jgi:hypothetical protein
MSVKPARRHYDLPPPLCQSLPDLDPVPLCQYFSLWSIALAHAPQTLPLYGIISLLLAAFCLQSIHFFAYFVVASGWAMARLRTMSQERAEQ